MTDDEGAADGDEPGVPDSDPEHLDPAGDLADAVEANVSSVDLDDDAEDLRAFIDAAESGAFGPIDPGLEATVRTVPTSDGAAAGEC